MDVQRLLWAMLACLAASVASAELRATHDSVEARAADVMLPSGPLSTLVVTPCRGCSPMSLLATGRTQYLVGRQPATLEELRHEVRRRPDSVVVVIWNRQTRELFRVRVSAP
ncbi:MAG: hypothetical protein DIU56_002855 [Pseudomonadota bacterium]|nr:MAG: hypothetical protein DIU56_14060 [Pseudomonadota bacterium]